MGSKRTPAFQFLAETKLELSPASIDQVKSALPTKLTSAAHIYKDPPPFPIA